MGRRKVQMGLIESKKTRLRTFANRKNGIMKKANELSKLCDVDVGVIIYGPNSEGKPHVWPQELHKLANILRRYQTTSEEERQKRVTNLSSVSSTKDIDTQNIDLEGFSADQLIEMINGLDFKLGIVKERIDLIKSNQNSIKFQEVESCGCEEQGMNVGVQVQPSGFQWEYQPDDQQYDEEQKLMMMMMMMNGGSCFNPTNDNVGDCSGLMGMENHQNHCSGVGMWNANPNPLTWFCDPITLHQLQLQQLQLQQLNGVQDQLPVSMNDFTNFYQPN